MNALLIIFYSAAFLLFVLTFIPLLKSPKWYVRVWDYPRLQIFALILILLSAITFLVHEMNWTGWLTAGALIGCLCYQGWQILPFTVFAKKMAEDETQAAPRHILKLLTANVYQENRDYSRMLALVNKKQPDIVFMLETDQYWKDGMQPIKETFPYHIEVPKSNTYGLLFYSKWPIIHHQVQYLIDEEIPSIIADIKLEEKTIRLYGIHPTPPVPGENEESTERDAEILLMGRKAREYEGPCVLFGDLNDVAWSHTTRLFLRNSKMLDPRIGRGMFSTFHAKYPLFRWPLDHFFVSSHFRIIDLNVEKNIGSDHFPISLSISLQHRDEEKEPEADAADKKEASEIISEAVSS